MYFFFGVNYTVSHCAFNVNAKLYEIGDENAAREIRFSTFGFMHNHHQRPRCIYPSSHEVGTRVLLGDWYGSVVTVSTLQRHQLPGSRTIYVGVEKFVGCGLIFNNSVVSVVIVILRLSICPSRQRARQPRVQSEYRPGETPAARRSGAFGTRAHSKMTACHLTPP